MAHIIRTQVIEVITDQPAEAFSLQHAVSGFFYRSILPVLEKTFDEMGPGGETIYVDRIEIDLHTITKEELERASASAAFSDKLYRDLKEALLLRVAKPALHQDILNIPGQWMFYMRNGYLPWNTRKTDNHWHQRVLQAFATDYASIASLRSLISTNALALSRIAAWHDDVFLAHLVEALTATNQDSLPSMLHSLAEIWTRFNVQDNLFRKQAEKAFWQNALRIAANTNWNLSHVKMLSEILQSCLPPNKIKKFSAFLQNSREHVALARMLQTDDTIGRSGTDENIVGQQQTSSRTKIPDDGIFVQHAGLVLLHPFLPHFFQLTDLAKNGRFRTVESQKRAVVLLNWAASNSETYEEHELTVSKILCGYPLGELIEPGILLTDDEKKEGEQLLHAVIAEWTILKNSSLQALRESFLQRGGKLVQSGSDDIRVLVEANALDVLMDRLPWALGIIKLPWAAYLIKVDWK